MNSLPNVPGSEAEILRLFNQFLKENGTGFDMKNLNFELKISKKDDEEAVGVMTMEMTPSAKPGINIQIKEETHDKKSPLLADKVESSRLSPVDTSPILDSEVSKTMPSTEPKFSSFGGMSSIEPKKEEQAENENQTQMAAEKENMLLSFQSDGVEAKLNPHSSLNREDPARLHLFERKTRSSLRANATDQDGRESVISQIIVNEMEVDTESKNNFFRKETLITSKMEELYLRELRHYNSNEAGTVMNKRTSRSVRVSYSPTRLRRKPPMAGHSLSSKTLIEYIEIKEKVNIKDKIPPTYLNVFGEIVKLPEIQTVIKETLPKYKSMAPTRGNMADVSNPAENEDDKLLKHFGEVSLLSAGDNLTPATTKKELTLKKPPSIKVPPPTEAEKPEKVSVPTSPLPDCFEMAEEDQCHKKKTKISHLMQQMEGDGTEDDGGELLGLLEAAKSNEEAWNREANQNSDLEKLESIMGVV